MTILAIGLLVIMGGFSEGGRARHSAYLYTRAINLSESLLDEKLAAETLSEGTQSGKWEEAADFSWVLEITPWEAPRPEAAPGETVPEPPKDAPRWFWVTLTASWPDGANRREFVLSTIAPEKKR
jgi:hypothetical protein